MPLPLLRQSKTSANAQILEEVGRIFILVSGDNICRGFSFFVGASFAFWQLAKNWHLLSKRANAKMAI